MGGYVGCAPACYGSTQIKTSFKIQNERNKQRSGQHTVANQKIDKNTSLIVMACVDLHSRIFENNDEIAVIFAIKI
jgi:hypothetical protein